MSTRISIQLGTITDLDSSDSAVHKVVAEVTSRPFRDTNGVGLVFSATVHRISGDRQHLWLPEVDYKSPLGKMYSKPRTEQQKAQVHKDIAAAFESACMDAVAHYQSKFPNHFNPEI